MKKTIRLTECDLHRIIKESVRRVLNEEIGDGTFPNADALVDKDVRSVEKALVNAGFRTDEYGHEDRQGRFGYVVYINDETEQEVKIIYPWIEIGRDSHRAGKIVRAEVYNDLIYHEKPYQIATSKSWDGYVGAY